MPALTKIKKLHTLLKFLKRQLATPQDISITVTFRDHKMASDYGTLLLSKGVILKVSGGRRGQSTYKWNNDFEATAELATLLMEEYNEKRALETSKRGEFITNKDYLLEIKEELSELRRMLKDIKDSLTTVIPV